MSTQPDTTSDSASSREQIALGSREDFWGDDDPTPDAGNSGHSEVNGTDAPEQIARQLALRFEEPICTRTLNEPAWNGGRLAELVAWLCDGECIDGRGDQLHHDQCIQSLTEPALPMPRQIEVAGRIIEYGSHRCRRRYNPETGYINWGETTGTGIPEFDYGTYRLCVDTYLAERFDGLRITKLDDYIEYAERVWSDPTMGSKDSLAQFIRHVRDAEQDTE